MVKGPAGYGRYDDDPRHVACPRARSSRSRCVARDGRTALDDAPAGEDRFCHACANDLQTLVEDLTAGYPPAAGLPVLSDQETLADEFALMVREATEPGKESHGNAAT